MPDLEDVLNDYVASTENPSYDTLCEWIEKFPQYKEDLTEFTIAWSLMETLPMPTKTRLRTTIELNPGDKERLQDIALSLGIIQPTGPDAGKIGSVSRLMQAIAKGEIKLIKDKAP